MTYESLQSLHPIRINERRISERIRCLAKFGMNREGGIDRSLGSKADIQAREWLKNLWKTELQAAVAVDPAANLWAERKGKEKIKPIVLGSHHDAVANGGKYDGAVGVLLATEVVQSLKEANYKLRHPIKVVSFSAEEPNPYNISTLGSRLITGVLDSKQVGEATHVYTHEKLSETLKRLGGDVGNVANHLLTSDDVGAFLECHIEQGRHLTDHGLSLAVVSSITGIYREEITIDGEANHAGTTMMENRHDALLAGAELSLAVEQAVIGQGRSDVVGTVGHFEIFPNSANIIPGQAHLILEMRTSNDQVFKELRAQLADTCTEIENKRQIIIKRKTILDQKAVPMDPLVRTALQQSIKASGDFYLDLPSMAGHDSVHMVPIAKTGMLFVPSIEGKSHCPEEETRIEDIVKAGNVLIRTVIALDKELD
ncbi:hydantoinase/carbamoylase family amidase [Sporolactobacillus shoreicorticis]|uniref:Hydantoinase/carbamoylase family amidase n=1 Tax=Sporolactobacillus shoreicorticis TaxID=1923877 RepID=A0ABW5S2R0_9BACL|nr:hydantoinase/carbamoylase family amidase [Sporolactobacillus shoreicorticis]MCO7125286.1 hydantoinase/carbamoylase family amidase [Sporolactobacillus shoreicorticis]